jgi:outer membrane lipoprotein SlyB
MSPDVYDAENVGQTQATYAATVVSIRLVTVQDGDRLQDNTLGGVGGGVAGALLGSGVGHGMGTVAAEIGGAIVGATAGAFAEKELKTEQGAEYIVELENGELKTIVQSVEPHFEKGDKVWLLEARHGRSRIIQR